MEQKHKKTYRSQWTAQHGVAAELTRRGYVVTFTMGNHTPRFDLLVTDFDGGSKFTVDVKSLSEKNSWNVKKRSRIEGLFYIFVLINKQRSKDRFFILTQDETNENIKEYKSGADGFGFSVVEGFEDRWDKLQASQADVSAKV